MADVFFTKRINQDALVEAFKKLNTEVYGNVGVKISTGELGGNNYLKPELIEKLVKLVNGTILECNTAYEGKRESVKDHLETIHAHGFDKIAKVDIMDSEGEEKIPLNNGKHLKYDIVGTHLKNYDTIINLAHFKGHAMGGFGGAMKNQSIGVASRNGKAYIHTAGKVEDAKYCWSNLPEQNDFLESMAEASKAVADYMDKKGGKILYISVMNNLSVDCDCDSNPESPCMEDIGILASLDPVSLDQACIDLIWSSKDKGRDHFIARVERQNGRHILGYAESIGHGSRKYNLIEF